MEGFTFHEKPPAKGTALYHRTSSCPTRFIFFTNQQVFCQAPARRKRSSSFFVRTV